MTTGATRRPRIVLAVANDITADARVRKYVETAALTGADVTVVGITTGKRLEDGRVGAARLLRVPVDHRLRRAAARSRDPDHRTEALDEAAHRFRAEERELSARIGALKSEGRRVRRLRRWRLRGIIADLRAEAAARRTSFDSWVVEERRAIEELRAAQERPGAFVPNTRSPIDWRSYAPEFLDLEVAVGPVVDELEADVLHAHDVHLLGVLARSKQRRAGAGQPVRLVYDAHEFIPGLYHPDPRHVDALASMEAEFITECDEVVAVSGRVADELQARHGLATRPTVVHNAPIVASRDEGAPSIRQVVGASDDDVLLVYSGGVHAGRGLEVFVDALALLPRTHHGVIVTKHPTSGYIAGLRQRAHEAGTAERFHAVDFVPPAEVVEFLQDADIGIDPMRDGWSNHEWTLPNKVFEYTAAGLALVVSHLEEISRFVAERDLGATFRPGDAADLARAIEDVAARRGEIRSRRDENQVRWSDQVDTVVDIYRRMTGVELDAVAPTGLPEPTAGPSDEELRMPSVGLPGAR